jgi:transcriptional regulator with XRE-family HTH domain
MLSVMDTNAPTLSEFMRRRRAELGLSTADVERISRQGGNKGISSGYISLIETGQTQNVSPEKLSVLARVYQLTDSEVFAIASKTTPKGTDITEERLARINFGYKDMPEKKKRQLDPLIDLLERELRRLKKETN